MVEVRVLWILELITKLLRYRDQDVNIFRINIKLFKNNKIYILRWKFGYYIY